MHSLQKLHKTVDDSTIQFIKRMPLNLFTLTTLWGKNVDESISEEETECQYLPRTYAPELKSGRSKTCSHLSNHQAIALLKHQEEICICCQLWPPEADVCTDACCFAPAAFMSTSNSGAS